MKWILSSALQMQPFKNAEPNFIAYGMRFRFDDYYFFYRNIIAAYLVKVKSFAITQI